MDDTLAGQGTAIGPTRGGQRSLSRRTTDFEGTMAERGEDLHHFLKARFHFGLSESH